MWKKEAVRKVRVLREVQDADDDEVQDGDEDEDAHDDDGDAVRCKMMIVMRMLMRMMRCKMMMIVRRMWILCGK